VTALAHDEGNDVDNSDAPIERARRRSVWEAMSAFFLDTELTAADHARIADVLRESGYTLDELDRILWHELCPALWGNTVIVAGEWSGFDMAELERRILQRPAGAIRRWLSYYAGGRSARHDWAHVRAILAAAQPA
jgi:hypothetical protein